MLAMLATKGLQVPGTGREAGQWVHEVKWDGVRILADVAAGAAEAQLRTRTGNEVTVAWPDVRVAPEPGRDLLVDGEVIALNEHGRPDFGVVATRLHTRSARTASRLAVNTPATFMVFDLLRLDGRDLTGLPWEQRRAALEELDLSAAGWQVPGTYDDGEMLLAATREQQLEGVVSKRLSSRYEPGVRSRNWLKFAHRARVSMVIGGWRPQVGTDHRLAALLVGEPTPGGLVYRGRVGSGISATAARMLSQRLAAAPATASPFLDPVPRDDALGTLWVEPLVVVEVESLGRSSAGRLRQPTYLGVREDQTPADLLSQAVS